MSDQTNQKARMLSDTMICTFLQGISGGAAFTVRNNGMVAPDPIHQGIQSNIPPTRHWIEVGGIDAYTVMEEVQSIMDERDRLKRENDRLRNLILTMQCQLKGALND